MFLFSDPATLLVELLSTCGALDKSIEMPTALDRTLRQDNYSFWNVPNWGEFLHLPSPPDGLREEFVGAGLHGTGFLGATLAPWSS